MRSVAIAVMLFVSSGVALAKGDLQLDIAKPDFAQQKQSIESAIVSGQEFTEITATDREAVVAGLAVIAAELPQSGSLEALDASTRERLVVEQAQINQRLRRAIADSRLVCTQEQVTGSNRKKRICTTVAARRRATGQS